MGGERGGRRDYRERDRDGGSERERDGGRERDTRERDHRERDGGREGRDRPRERSRDRARDTKRDTRKDVEPEKDIPNPRHVEEEFTKARTATPPVSFKVNSAVNGQDHERMDVDAEEQPAKKGKKGKKAAKPIEEDDDLI